MKDLVLVAAWFVDDNWYGKRYRAMLGPFQTKTEANKFKAKLKKFVLRKYKRKVANDDMTVGERDTFKDYIYNSFGPSLSYKHFPITVEDIDKMMAEIASEKLGYY